MHLGRLLDSFSGRYNTPDFALEQVFDDLVIVPHGFQVGFSRALRHSFVWRPVIPIV